MPTVSALKTEKNHDRMSQEESFSDKFQEVASDVVEKVKTVGESIPKAIRQYPLQSLAIGFGVGLLAAALIGRRNAE